MWRKIAILLCYLALMAIVIYVFQWKGAALLTIWWLFYISHNRYLPNNNNKTMQTAEKMWVPVSVKDGLPTLTEENDTKSKVVVVIIDEIRPEGGEYYGDKRQDLVVPTLNLAYYTKHLGWCWSFGDQIVPSVVERLTFWLEEKDNSCGCNQ